MSYQNILKLRKLWADTKIQAVNSSKIIDQYLLNVKPIRSVQVKHRQQPFIKKSQYVDQNEKLITQNQNQLIINNLAQQDIKIKDNYYPWWFDVFEYKFLGKSFTPTVLNCDIIILYFQELSTYKLINKQRIQAPSIIRKVDDVVYAQRKQRLLVDSPMINSPFFQCLAFTFQNSDVYTEFWFQQRKFNWVKIIKKQIELMDQAMFVAPRLRQIKLLRKEYIQGEQTKQKWEE